MLDKFAPVDKMFPDRLLSYKEIMENHNNAKKTTNKCGVNSRKLGSDIISRHSSGIISRHSCGEHVNRINTKYQFKFQFEGDIILTGATGFCGSNFLYYILAHKIGGEEGKIHIVLR